jgi:hypothetical protein
MDRANTWIAKEGDTDYEKFLQEYLKVDDIVPDAAMVRLEQMLQVCHRKVPRHGLRPAAKAFFNSEAEARVFAYLMQNNKVSSIVHLDSTHSPCGACCQTFAVLSPLYSMSRNIANRAAHRDLIYQTFRADFEAAGLDSWKIGRLYFGRIYDGGIRPSDLNLLRQAVRDGGIGGFTQISI